MRQIERKKLSLIVYDFDGVMTDNKVHLREDGTESVTVCRGDGFAVSEIKKLGIQQIILSTETNPVVAARAKKLGIPAIHGAAEKKGILLAYLREQKIEAERVLYLGNDLNDYDCMLAVGYRGCPADAEQEVIAICGWVSERNGGDGVVRDLLRCLTG